MGLRNSSVLCLALFLAFSSSIQGLDITKTLSNYPQFAKFSKYLTETKLADQINSQKAVTILALDDAALSSLSGKSVDAIKAVLGSHVVLGFYDERELSWAQGSHTRLSTIGGPGIFVGLINEGETAFSSADNQNSYDSKLVQPVTYEAGIVSLLQVTAPIVVPGAADAAATSKPASPSPPTQSSSPPSASPPTPSSSPSPRKPSSSSPPTPSSSSPSPSSSSPKPSSPVSSPSTPPSAAAVAPVAEANAPDVADSTLAPSSSSASRAVVGLVSGAVMAMASLFFSL